MFCCYCGKETEDGAMYCQYCGQYIAAEKKVSVSTKKAPKKKRKRVLALLGVFVLLLAAGGGLACTLLQKGEEPEAGGNAMAVLRSGFTDIQIVDENSAIEAAAEAGARLGYENAAAELTSYVTTAVDGQQFYRLQQNYRGYPVYGKYVIVVADESGESLSMISYAQDIPEDISLNASINDQQATESIAEYARSNWAAVYDDMTISPLSDDALVIYDQDMDARLAYCLTVQNGDPYEVIVDAQTAEVLGWRCLTMRSNYNTRRRGTLAQDPSVDFPIIEKKDQNGQFQFYAIGIEDEDQGAVLFYANGNKNNDDNSMLISSDNDIFGENTDPVSGANLIKGIDVITVSEDIIDYYQESYNQQIPLKQLRIEYDSGYPDQATSGDTYAIIRINRTSSGYEEGIAHEYTHCVQIEHDAAVGGYYSSRESGAIAEGLADLFALFYIDSWEYDTKDSNTKYRIRSAIDPAGNHYAEKITDPCPLYFLSDSKYYYMTVISHAAYLMADSGAFGADCYDTDELAVLWYKTMIQLPSSCTYSTLRTCMENTAVVSGYSAAQMIAIADAFDAVGITQAVRLELACEFDLNVFDKQKNPYDDYEVTIDGYYTNLLNKKISCHYDNAEANEEICLEDGNFKFKKGLYQIIIKDNASASNGYSQIYFLDIDKSHNAEELEVYDFGADYVVSPGAELTVLDRNGDVLTDYTLAVSDGESLQFIEDGIIDLPEKNYYRFVLTYKGGTVAYNDFFTVRVKADGEDTMTRQTDFLKQFPTVPVSDVLCEAVKLSDGSVHCYHIPKIGTVSMNGDPFGEINREIYDQYYDWLQTNVYGCIYEYDEPYFINDMEYMSGQHLDVLSVVMYTNQWDVSYGIYNVSAVTGETLTTADVLGAYGLTAKEFRTKVKNALTGYLDSHTHGSVSGEAIRYSVENTLAEENIDAAVPFVGPDGNLCFLAKEHYLAGGGIGYLLIDAETGELIQRNLCEEDHSDILQVIKGKLTEEDALLAAYAFWDVKPEDAADDPDYYAVVSGIENINGIEYYPVYLRYLDSANGASWATTLDFVYVDVKTGECTQSPY